MKPWQSTNEATKHPNQPLQVCKHTCAHNNAQSTPSSHKQARSTCSHSNQITTKLVSPNTRSRTTPHPQNVVAPLTTQISPRGFQMCTCAPNELDQPSNTTT